MRPILVQIVGDEASLSRALGKASAEVSSFGTRLQTAGKKMQSVGSTMTRNLTLPIVAAGVVSAKFAIDFQKQMEMIHTQAGASTAEVTKMSAAVLKLAQITPQGPIELSKALFHIESVGYRGAKALNVLHTAALGAAVGNSNLEDTASALSAVMITNIKGTQNYGHAMGVLNATVGAGNMRMSDLVEALKSGIVPTAKVAGLSLQGLTAALAMLTDEGVPAGIAANRLRTALLMITNPSAKAQAALKSIGLSSLDLGHQLQKPDGLFAALTMLKAKMAGITDPTKRLALIGDMFGGSRSAGTIAMLLNNLGRVQMKYQQIGATASHFNKDVLATQQTAAYKLNVAWSNLQATMIQIGATAVPIFVRIAQAVSKLVGAFSGLSKGTQDFILLGLAATAALGPILKLGGNLMIAGGGVVKLATKMGLLGTATADAGGAAATAGGAAGFGSLALAITAVALPVAGLTYLWVTNKKATYGMAPAYNSLQSAIKGLPQSFYNLKSAIQSAHAAEKAATQTAKQEPGNIGAINKAVQAQEKALYRLAAANDKWKSQLHDLKTGITGMISGNTKYTATLDSLTKHLQGTRAGGYALWQQQQQLGGSSQQLTDRMNAVSKSAGALAQKMQQSDPVLAANARKVMDVAGAAAILGARIYAIPAFKRITILMQISELINRYVGPTTGPPHGTPGNPHGASGAIVTRPTWAMIGEAGAEAVIPLNRMPGASPLGKIGGAAPVIHNTITLDGRQLAFAIRGELIKLGVQTGQSVLRGYA